MVTELDQLISEEYGIGFYDSCKDVKFGPSNAKAMDFIGGGAKNYTQLLKFLGDEKAIGSPFQINFPRRYSEPGMGPIRTGAKSCSDPGFQCACVDCPAQCPTLPDVEHAGSCHVGVLPCLSFASIFTYSILLFTSFVAVAGHVAWKRHARRRTERLRLLTDAAPSDDEDEGDLTQNGAMFDQPQRRYRGSTRGAMPLSASWVISPRDSRPSAVGGSLVVVLVLSLGWVRFELEKDPARL